ncbi:hypothetical protein LINGRAHAP2_LOCUS8304 [Linum grandiflorum]
MNPFPFRSNNHFVSSSDGTILQVYELTKSINHLHTIHKSDWKKLAIIIHTSLEEDDDDADIDPKPPEEMSFNGLLFFDGHGRIEGKKALPMLAKHLKELHLLVSPEGYCFQQAFDLGSYFDFGIYYLRLNDLFSWPHHGVDIAKTNVWRRSELRYQYLPRRKNNTSKWPAGCCKEKYAELERIVKEKDEELEKLKEEINEANEKLKKADEEHRKQLKKNDNELRILSKKKGSEEAKTKRIKELENSIEANDEELLRLKKDKDEEIRMVLKTKEAEIGVLKNNRDDAEGEKKKMIEELEKVKEETKTKNQTLDEELQKLKREMNDEASVEAELEEVREQLRYIVSEVENEKKELEKCRKKSWAILPSTKFLTQSLDAKDKYLAIRLFLVENNLCLNVINALLISWKTD